MRVTHRSSKPQRIKSADKFSQAVHVEGDDLERLAVSDQLDTHRAPLRARPVRVVSIHEGRRICIVRGGELCRGCRVRRKFAVTCPELEGRARAAVNAREPRDGARAARA